MHSAIFVADYATADHNVWNNFTGDVHRNLKGRTGVSRLAESVWLLNFRLDPTPLAFLVASAEERKVRYGILPLDDEPQWPGAGVGEQAGGGVFSKPQL